MKGIIYQKNKIISNLIKLINSLITKLIKLKWNQLLFIHKEINKILVKYVKQIKIKWMKEIIYSKVHHLSHCNYKI